MGVMHFDSGRRRYVSLCQRAGPGDTERVALCSGYAGDRVTKDTAAVTCLRCRRHLNFPAYERQPRKRAADLTAARDRVVEAAREETEAEAAWTWEAVTKMQESEAYARVEAARKERRAAVAALLALNEGRSE